MKLFCRIVRGYVCVCVIISSSTTISSATTSTTVESGTSANFSQNIDEISKVSSTASSSLSSNLATVLTKSNPDDQSDTNTKENTDTYYAASPAVRMNQGQGISSNIIPLIGSSTSKTDVVASTHPNDDFITTVDSFLSEFMNLVSSFDTYYDPEHMPIRASAMNHQSIHVAVPRTIEEKSSVSSIASSSNMDHLLTLVHENCAVDIELYCYSDIIFSYPRSSSNGISLGYTCKRIENCLWNHFESRLLSKPCGQAILNVRLFQNERVELNPLQKQQQQRVDFAMNVPLLSQDQLVSLKLHSCALMTWMKQQNIWILRMIALIASFFALYYSVTPFHHFSLFRRYLHGSKMHRNENEVLHPNQHCRAWHKKRQILHAIRNDPSLKEHVERVLGESISEDDLLPPHKRFSSIFVGWFYNHTFHFCSILVSKCSLVTFILTFSWTNPILSILFFGFCIMMMLTMYTLISLVKIFFLANDNHDDDDEKQSKDAVEQELHSNVRDTVYNTSNVAFIGVPVKIV